MSNEKDAEFTVELPPGPVRDPRTIAHVLAAKLSDMAAKQGTAYANVKRAQFHATAALELVDAIGKRGHRQKLAEVREHLDMAIAAIFGAASVLRP